MVLLHRETCETALVHRETLKIWLALCCLCPRYGSENSETMVFRRPNLQIVRDSTIGRFLRKCSSVWSVCISALRNHKGGYWSNCHMWRQINESSTSERVAPNIVKDPAATSNQTLRWVAIQSTGPIEQYRRLLENHCCASMSQARRFGNNHRISTETRANAANYVQLKAQPTDQLPVSVAKHCE